MHANYKVRWCQLPGEIHYYAPVVQCYVVCVCHLLDHYETPLCKVT